MIFLASWSLSLSSNLGSGKIWRANWRNLRTKNGNMFQRKSKTRLQRSKLKFGWPFTACSRAKKQTENMRSPPSENLTYWGLESIWTSSFSTNYQCSLACWEPLKKCHWWVITTLHKRTHSSCSNCLRWEQISWEIEIGKKLPSTKEKISSTETSMTQRRTWSH